MTDGSTLDARIGHEPRYAEQDPVAALDKTPMEPRNDAASTSDASTRRQTTLLLPPVVKWLVSYAGFTAIILAQLGYTLVLAVESMFGIGRDSLLRDWSHLVSLGAPLLLSLVAFALDALADPRLYAGIARVYGWQFIVLALLLAACLRFRTTLRTRARGLASRISAATSRLFVGLGVLALGTLAVFPALLLLLSAVALPAIAIPLLGLRGAQKYLYEVVIEPDHCLPVHSLAERRSRHNVSVPQAKRTAALCLAITRDQKPTEVGRLVLSGPNYMVLYNPNTGATRNVPTGEAVVEAVSSLD